MATVEDRFCSMPACTTLVPHNFLDFSPWVPLAIAAIVSAGAFLVYNYGLLSGTSAVVISGPLSGAEVALLATTFAIDVGLVLWAAILWRGESLLDNNKVKQLGSWASKTDGSAEIFDRLFRGASAGIGIAQNTHILQGTAPAPVLAALSHNIDSARGALSAFRFIPALGKVVTLKSFWKEDSTGVTGPSRWDAVVCDILVVAARCLSPFYWMHKLGVDLGKHAKQLGSAIAGFFMAAISLSFLSSIYNFCTAKAGEVKEAAASLLSDFLDVLAMPADFDLGNIMQSAELALIGSITMLVSSIVCLWKNTV